MSAPFCQRCEGTGFLPDWETNTDRPCECRQKVLHQRRLQRLLADVPSRYRGVALTRAPICFFDEPVLKRLRAYVRGMNKRIDEGRGLWLSGPVGTGKTAAAWMLVQEARERGHAAALHPLVDLLLELRATYDDDALEGEHTLVAKLTQIDLLVIDDIAAIKTTPHAIQAVYRIINRRYNEARATIVTTDLDYHAAGRVLGRRTVDRLVQMTGRPVTFDGDSHRLASLDDDVLDLVADDPVEPADLHDQRVLT